MAYNNPFPTPYPSPYYNQINPYYHQMQQAMAQQQQAQQQQLQQQMQPQAIQQSGFVLVQSEQEARAYPVAPGNSITFKDESQPYCYVKTMGFNQLDRPIFERYRLVKEETPSEVVKSPTANAEVQEGINATYALKSDLGALWDEIDAIKESLKAQGEKKATKQKKATETEDEDNE